MTSQTIVLDNGQMMTVTEFAAKVGLSRQRIHQLMKDGRIFPKPQRVGHAFVVHRNARLTTVNSKRKV